MTDVPGDDPRAFAPHDATAKPGALPRAAFDAIGFGPTVFDAVDGAGELPALHPAPRLAFDAFDACHVGVVLRTLLLVHAVVGVAMLFDAGNAAAWLGLIATGASVALPAVLLWLVLACAGKRWLGRLPAPAQSVAAALLGAICAVAGSMPARWLGADVAGSWRWVAFGLAGAGLALGVFHWLKLRVQATLPAATTARLAELQSRIRPHFLFNTLNTALALVRFDPTRAETVLENLAELFRVAISDNDDAATLAEEVELARRYIAIEQIRFGSRLTVTWDLDPLAGAARVPPLLLQPLVENAVRHGVEPAAEGGVVRIQTRVRRGRAVLSIVNSVPPQPSVPGHGIALRNVRERLRLMHDVAAEFDARRENDVFRVEVVVPL